MRCSRFRKIVLPMMMEAKDEEELALSLAGTDVRLKAHLDSCEGCRSYLRSCREALGRLSSMKVEEPSEREWERVRAAIHRSVGEEAPVYRVVWPQLASVSWARVGAVAVVAILICVGSLIYFRARPVGDSIQGGIQGTLDIAFLDEIEATDREYDEVITEIDELMREIDTAYAQIDADTGDVSLKDRIFEDILT